ncbi:MAG: hypothetical protein QOF84_6877 [Streptomyces sp.]|nr:hypothetical protein [Streptomyces sp.]
MNRAPHKRVVGKADQRQVRAEHPGVHGGGPAGHHRWHRQSPPPVGGEQDRGQRDQQQVDRHKPQMQGDEPADLASSAVFTPAILAPVTASTTATM